MDGLIATLMLLVFLAAVDEMLTGAMRRLFP